MDSLKISLLGPPILERGGEEIVNFSYHKSPALLYYLAMTPGGHSRLFLAGLLWGEMPDQKAMAALSRSLSDLRKHVGSHLDITTQTVAFNREVPYWLDVEVFERNVRSAWENSEKDDAHQAIQLLREATALYRGDLLEGFHVRRAFAFEEALIIARERLQLLVIQALQILIKHDISTGNLHRGIQDTQRLLALEPTNEAAHAQLMNLFAHNSQRSAALRQYETCREILKRELDLEPAAETVALYKKILNGEIGDGDGFQVLSAPVVYWGDAPTLMPLHGRAAEMTQLKKWVFEEKSRLVAILGMGGQGKTALVATFARSYSSSFEVLLWHSLLNAPPLVDVVQGWLERLAPEGASIIPQNLDGKLDRLLELLQKKRCLLILDNAESIMQSGQHAGQLRSGYESYDQLLRRFALGDHQSCLLITSREKPQLFAQLERRHSPVFSLALSGLEAAAGRAIFEEENLRGSEEELETLVRQYSGNPLALILIADTIKNFHDGHTAAFLNTETSVFANIQVVLEQQFVRLTRLEEQIMLWLAVEREPVAIQLLAEQIQLPHTQANLIAALHSLHQRSLIERRVNGFTLQNVLMEFTTDFLVSAVVKELVQGQVDYFAHLPLLKASAMTYVRRTQERLLLQPVARQLLYRGGKNQAISLLKELLASLPTPILQYSYAPGNILNLLVYLDVKEPLDFSDAAVWQVNLRGKVVPPISFSGANLNGAAFTDYGGYILKLAFNADGTRLAGSAISGEIRLWDMGTRKPLLTIAGHQDFAGSLCFSPDGRFLVSGGGDGNACVWDAETGRRLHRYPTHDNAVRPVVFAPDGKWIAGASFNRLTFWNPTSDETLFSHSFSNGYVEALAVSPNGGILAFSNKECIQLWDIQATLAAGAGQVLHKFFSNQDRIKQLAFSPDGQLVASNGNKVRLWEVKTGQTVMDLVAGTHQIESIAFHPDGEIIAGGSKDSIYLWNVRSGELLRAFVAHEETIVSLIFNPDGNVLVSSSEDHTVRLWDMNGQNLHTIQGFVNMIHGVDLSPDGRFLACGSDDRMVRLWDFHSGELLDTWRGHESRVHRVVFSPDGKSLAASSRDRLVRVWAVPSGEEKYQLPTGEVPYHAVAWSPDCLWLATGDREGALSIWEAENGKHYKTFFHDTIVCAVSFPVSGEHVAAVCFDNKIYIWEMGNSHLKQILPGHDNEVWALEHSPDGRFLVSGSDDCTVRFWDLASGECRHVLEHHTGWVQALAFDRRGDLMLTGSQDQSIGIWDVSRLNLGGPPQLIYSLNGHTARVTDVSFCPDGTTIVSSSLDETIRFWAVSTGECLDKWAIPGPYKGMDITNASGLTKAQRRSLRSLGAVEKSWSPNTDS